MYLLFYICLLICTFHLYLGNYLDLRRNHLAYTDLVSPDRDITFTLMNKPASGNLTKFVEGNYIPLQKGDTFTQQDINDLLIR